MVAGTQIWFVSERPTDTWVLDSETETLEHSGAQASLLGDLAKVQLTWCPLGKIADKQYLVAQCQRGVGPGRTAAVPFETFEYIPEYPPAGSLRNTCNRFAEV